MNKKIKETALSISAATAGLFGGLILWQKACFWQAQKSADDALFEIYASTLGDIAYTSMGHGRPLLLIHSMMLGTSRREWDMVISSLSEHYHVYAIDLPGFGNSFLPDKPWTAYQYAHIIHEFMDQVIRRPACILASNGGSDLALVTSMLYSEKIKGMMLISPQGFGRGFATNEDLKPLHGLLLPVSGTQQFLLETTKSKIKASLETAFFAKEKIQDDLVQTFYTSARGSKNRQITFATLKTGFWRADTKAAFAGLTVPFWIFWGEENKTNPISFMEWAENTRLDGEYVIFEEVGNFPHMENSDNFLKIVKEYLK
ncbi:alpha/beta fold hydrolase [Anaerotignum sp.]|uniref:alpha/beta fold hydrolase n=1 Tax=Anaerotignum sp. TaxID=2039241 RepID=UPI00289E46C6|nr:alpha/beta hydrolase [Anaerotignum sp.]